MNSHPDSSFESLIYDENLKALRISDPLVIVLCVCRSDNVPAIFLTHSGKQKPFVESLYSALRRVNHKAFFDQHSLPKGSTFPQCIKTAALGCELGVVVLSEDFLTSKWPMIELEILVLQRGPKAKLLPLFYKLGPADLKSPANLAQWQQVWEEKVGASNLHQRQVERSFEETRCFQWRGIYPGH
ncbi:hypothetical protein GOP47_0030990 [Adiantum capillus-veneris]|nr:hypothetical protein GOP47_0030990 [Adiantum capillus-veneris]